MEYNSGCIAKFLLVKSVLCNVMLKIKVIFFKIQVKTVGCCKVFTVQVPPMVTFVNTYVFQFTCVMQSILS